MADYVENFELGDGNTYAVRDAEAQTTITTLQSLIDEANATITQLNTALTAAQGDISTNTANIATNASDIDSLNTSLTNQITELNETLTESSTVTIEPLSSISGASFGNWSVTAVKKVGIVTLFLNCQGTIDTVATWVEIMNIPTGYRPASQIYQNYIAQNGTPMLIQITNTGRFYVQVPSVPIESNIYFLRQCISFVTA